MAASQLSSEDDFELIGGEVSPSSKSIGLSESSETLPTTQEVVEDDVAAPAAAEELPVQLPTSEDAAAADEDATREEGAEGAEVDDDDRSSEDDDFDERDPPRYLDLERVGARTAKMVWEADPVEVLDEAAAAAGVASERKRGPAFVVQIAEDSFWASWGDPVACADNCVRFVELTPSTAFVVRVARCIAAADEHPGCGLPPPASLPLPRPRGGLPRVSSLACECRAHITVADCARRRQCWWCARDRSARSVSR
jgi:hypothetical protein